MTEEYNDDWKDDSGPFCQHWSDPSECEKICATCGHECRWHTMGEKCRIEGCDCEKFMDKEEKP